MHSQAKSNKKYEMQKEEKLVEKGDSWHMVVRKPYNQPGRLVMKIQSVTLNWEVSLAMNLLGGRQHHRQRLIPTEERRLQDTTTLKITAWLLFLNMKAWLKRLYVCLFNFHFQLWTQFCGQTATGKNKLATASIMQHLFSIKGIRKWEKRPGQKYSGNK